MDLSDASLDSTGTRAALELRVLSGRQAGARALLASDGAWTRLGHGLENDLVLREAPFEVAEIGLQDGQWLWREGDSEPIALKTGQGLRMGAFTVLLCSPSLPWSPEPPQEWAIDRSPDGTNRRASLEVATDRLSGDTASDGQDAPASAPSWGLTEAAAASDGVNASDTDAAESGTDPSSETGAGTGAGAEAQAQAQAHAPLDLDSQTARTRVLPSALQPLWATPVRRAATVAGATAVVVAVGLLMPLGGGERGGPVASLAPSAAGGPSGGSSSTTAAPLPTSPSSGAPVAPVILPAQADLQAVESMLAAQPVLAQGLKASIGPDGRVALRGVVVHDEALETVLRPMVNAGLRISLQVLTAPEWAQRIQSLNQGLLPQGVQARGLPDGRVSLQGEVASGVAIDGLAPIVSQEIPEALGVNVAVVPRDVAQQVRDASVAAQALSQPKPPPMPRLPEVVSVIGGADAYIVLADGLRVSPGGQAGAWRVASIRAGRVTLVDSAGRSRSLEP